MKITLIGTLPPLKALSPYCFHLAKALSKKVDLNFISFKEIAPESYYLGGTKEKKIFKIREFSYDEALSWNNPISWIRTGIKFSGNILHVQHWAIYSSLAYCFILPIAKIRNKKILVTIHNITPHTERFLDKFINKIFNKFIFPFADAYIVHNVRNKKKLLELYKIDEGKIHILTHGTIYPYQQIKGISKNDSRKKLNINKDKKVVLFFGYVWDYKGLDHLLNSLKNVRKEIPNILLIIAGESLKDWQKYEKIIGKNNLEEHVRRELHYIPDSEIEYYFSSSDLVACPYKKHPFDTHGGVGALALSFAKPMIVTDVGGLPEYVKDKKVIANPNDSEDLAKKIILVLSDESFAKKLSKDSEELSKNLSWDKIADKTINVYEKL